MCLIKKFYLLIKSYIFKGDHFHKPYRVPLVPLPRLSELCVSIELKWKNDNKIKIKIISKNNRFSTNKSLSFERTVPMVIIRTWAACGSCN